MSRHCKLDGQAERPITSLPKKAISTQVSAVRRSGRWYRSASGKVTDFDQSKLVKLRASYIHDF